MTIQWFPGHMAKTRRLIQENLKVVDVVVEIVDARIPLSSQNPLLDELIKGKDRILVLNKADLADDRVSQAWIDYFESQEATKAIKINSLQDGKNIRKIIEEKVELLTREKRERRQRKGIRSFTSRVMIAGIPNVGKSIFINALIGRQSAKTGNKPGVTKGKQWVKLGKDMEIMDTPGILWPKFEDPLAGEKLALTGAIKDEVFHFEPTSISLVKFLKKHYPQLLQERYKLTSEEVAQDAPALIEIIGRKRGAIVKGGEVDFEKTAIIIINDFRKGSMGRISLEFPDQLTDDETKKS